MCRLELSQNLSDLIFVHDPLLPVHFLKEPTAERVWFSDGSLKVMEQSKKTVPEWVEYFQAAQEAAKEHVLVGAAPLDIEKHLIFVSQAQEFATPLKVANLKLEVDPQEELDSTIPPSSHEDQDWSSQLPWKEGSGLPDSVIEYLKRLGDTILRIKLSMHQVQVQDMNRYQVIAGDFEKVRAWQEHMTERIGKSVLIKERDFHSLWSALDYGVCAMEIELQECVGELKWSNEELNKEKVVLERDLRDLKDLVIKAFKEVEEILDQQFGAIEKQQEGLENKISL